MYSEDAITLLTNRIGFGTSANNLVGVLESNAIGTSGRTFPYFHRLSTIDNLHNTVANPTISETDFNDYLVQLKTDTVKAVLTKVLNSNEKYIEATDYSETIETRPELFDDAIGYTMASTIIESLMTTERSNRNERIIKTSYEQLKMELEGVYDDEGVMRVLGVRGKMHHAIKNAGLVIFPKTYLVEGLDNYW